MMINRVVELTIQKTCFALRKLRKVEKPVYHQNVKEYMILHAPFDQSGNDRAFPLLQTNMDYQG